MMIGPNVALDVIVIEYFILGRRLGRFHHAFLIMGLVASLALHTCWTKCWCASRLQNAMVVSRSPTGIIEQLLPNQARHSGHPRQSQIPTRHDVEPVVAEHRPSEAGLAGGLGGRLLPANLSQVRILELHRLGNHFPFDTGEAAKQFFSLFGKFLDCCSHD
jgi:hypothetical protein